MHCFRGWLVFKAYRRCESLDARLGNNNEEEEEARELYREGRALTREREYLLN